jgi:hypothetical protein
MMTPLQRMMAGCWSVHVVDIGVEVGGKFRHEFAHHVHDVPEVVGGGVELIV